MLLSMESDGVRFFHCPTPAGVRMVDLKSDRLSTAPVREMRSLSCGAIPMIKCKKQSLPSRGAFSGSRPKTEQMGGRTQAQIARELGVSDYSLTLWNQNCGIESTSIAENGYRIRRELGLSDRAKRRYRPQTADSSHREPIASNRLASLPKASRRDQI